LRADQPAVSARAPLAAALSVRADRVERGALPAEPPPPASGRRRPCLLGIVLVVPDRGRPGAAGGPPLRQANLAQLSQRGGRGPPRALGCLGPSLARARPRDRRALRVSSRGVRATRLPGARGAEPRGHDAVPVPGPDAAACALALGAQPRAPLPRRRHA